MYSQTWSDITYEELILTRMIETQLPSFLMSDITYEELIQHQQMHQHQQLRCLSDITYEELIHTGTASMSVRTAAGRTLPMRN